MDSEMLVKRSTSPLLSKALVSSPASLLNSEEGQREGESPETLSLLGWQISVLTRL